MEYNLALEGDILEKQYWPELKSSFSNYGILWSKFIVPLSRRVTDGDIRIRPDIDPLLEHLAMSHYSVFYHLCKSIEAHKNGFPNPEEYLFHLSASTEMVDRLVLAIVELNSKITNSQFIDYYSLDEVTSISHNFYHRRYKNYFDRFLKKGQSINVIIQNMDDISSNYFTKTGCKSKKDYKRWHGLSTQIRHYRNTLAHNPVLGTLSFPDGKRCIPKDPYLDKYLLWSVMFYKRDEREFTILEDLFTQFLSNFTLRTNILWSYFIETLTVISASDIYINMVNLKSVEGGHVTHIINEGPISTSTFPTSSGILHIPKDKHDS
jgi:hypothetical protein